MTIRGGAMGGVMGTAGTGLLCMLLGAEEPSGAQTEQVVDVLIRDSTFVTRQMPLALNVPIRIQVKNEDKIRHDFGSTIFRDTPTQIEYQGVIAYGQTVGGAFLDGGKSASFRFTLHRPGQYEFKCSIHPSMKGEILLMSVGAV